MSAEGRFSRHAQNALHLAGNHNLGYRGFGIVHVQFPIGIAAERGSRQKNANFQHQNAVVRHFSTRFSTLVPTEGKGPHRFPWSSNGLVGCIAGKRLQNVAQLHFGAEIGRFPDAGAHAGNYGLDCRGLGAEDAAENALRVRIELACPRPARKTALSVSESCENGPTCADRARLTTFGAQLRALLSRNAAKTSLRARIGPH